MSIEIEATPLTLRQRVLEAADHRTRVRLAEDRATLVALLLVANVVQAEPPKEQFAAQHEHVVFDLGEIRFETYTERRYGRNDDQGHEVILLMAQRICAHEGCTRTASASPTIYEVKELADLAPLFEERLADGECYFTGRHDTAPEGEDELEDLPF